MSSIQISADSTCDLPAALLEQYGICIAPLHIRIGGKEYLDGQEIDPALLFSLMEQEQTVGQTAAVNVGEYVDFFTRALERHQAVIHFTISGEMSSCLQNARIAAEQVGRVFVIDSRNLSSGMGLLVLLACRLAEQGLCAEEIVSRVEAQREKVDTSFVLDTLDCLKKGGRCSALAALGANLLRLKPCISVRAGAMGMEKKYRGTTEKVLTEYIRDRLSRPETVDPGVVFLTHSGLPQPLLEQLKAEALSQIPFREVYFTQAGCTISNHCGPSCFGILFFRK